VPGVARKAGHVVSPLISPQLGGLRVPSLSSAPPWWTPFTP